MGLFIVSIAFGVIYLDEGAALSCLDCISEEGAN
jgi:hypothetical protein